MHSIPGQVPPASAAVHCVPGRHGRGRRWGVALALAVAVGAGHAVAGPMPGAPKGVLETGAPSFDVLGREALGLSTDPIDLHVLPDGRVLVVSQHELAFGDGERWSAFQSEDNQQPVFDTVAVDGAGEIYVGTGGEIDRVVFNADARWQFVTATRPPKDATQNTTLVSVAAFPDRWLWYGGNGAIVAWRPGEQPRIAGHIGAIDRIFRVGKEVYVSEQSSGGMFRLKPDGEAEPVHAAEVLVSELVTCAVPFGPGQSLVGTGGAGLRIFDGKTFRRFGPPGLLNRGSRITDLCATGEGYFAAAIDTVGIVFFDREGHTVQVLDRTLDHRLARVQRLAYAGNGVLWALLTGGVARVEFPNPISQFAPLLASGLTYAQPLRHDGQLWIFADGRAMRGVYDASGRLERFTDDTPPGRYLFTLTDVDGQLFACNDEGIYVHENGGWRRILSGIVNARVGVAPSSSGRVYYVARGEYGAIEPVGGDYVARRVMMRELGDSYGCEIDASGVGWLELGTHRAGRFEVTAGRPRLTIFGPAEGLTGGWTEIYLLDGMARFHSGNQLWRFDDPTQKFVDDRELLARLPQLAAAAGRPVTDNRGRLWYTADGATQVIDRSPAGGNRPVRIAPVGFAATNYTAESDGVIWMFEKRRLVRMDPRLPVPPRREPRALITSVQLTASGHRLFAPGPLLDTLDYADNSLVIHFAAPANPFDRPVTFEVLLEGAGTQWISTGAIGSAAFNHLKEGSYVFHVRPVVAGAAPGAEARLQFAVRPPWFRTTTAWVLYVVAAFALIGLVTWGSSYLQRRENERLELLVTNRTAELNASNDRLAGQMAETVEKSAALSASEERFRALNAELETRVQSRTAELAEASGLLEALLANSPDLIYFKDRESRFVRFSDVYARRFKLEPDAVYGKTDFDLFGREHARQAFDDEQRIIRTGEPIVGKLEKEDYADGHVTWALTTKMPWRDGSGAIVGTFGTSKDVTAWKEAEAKLAETHKQLLHTSREAGMAEVATGVLHNVGNVLNSVNVSATLVADHIRHTKAANVARIAELFAQHKANLAAFLTSDPRGQMIPDYLGTLAEMLAAESTTVTAELENLRKNVEHIKEIVAMQQAYARTSGVIETVGVVDMVEDAIRINAGSLARHDVDTIRDYQVRPVVTTDKHKVIQILINLVRNAKYACDESGRTDKKITLRTTRDDHKVRIEVVDNGVGIPPENLTRIFNHGFTTRKRGHGFGLHSGALAAKELGGTLSVHSAGRDRGATFTLEIPYKPEAPDHADANS